MAHCWASETAEGSGAGAELEEQAATTGAVQAAHLADLAALQRVDAANPTRAKRLSGLQALINGSLGELPATQENPQLADLAACCLCSITGGEKQEVGSLILELGVNGTSESRHPVKPASGSRKDPAVAMVSGAQGQRDVGNWSKG